MRCAKLAPTARLVPESNELLRGKSAPAVIASSLLCAIAEMANATRDNTSNVLTIAFIIPPEGIRTIGCSCAAGRFLLSAPWQHRGTGGMWPVGQSPDTGFGLLCEIGEVRRAIFIPVLLLVGWGFITMPPAWNQPF